MSTFTLVLACLRIRYVNMAPRTDKYIFIHMYDLQSGIPWVNIEKERRGVVSCINRVQILLPKRTISCNSSRTKLFADSNKPQLNSSINIFFLRCIRSFDNATRSDIWPPPVDSSDFPLTLS